MTQVNILITDDEPELCDTLQEALEYQSHHYTIFKSYSGRDSFFILQNNPIDVLITDIRMPGMDGIELMEKARDMKPNLAVIILTGHGDLENAITALRLGADNYLQKPVSSQVLHYAIKNSWEKRVLARKLKDSETQFRTIFEQNSVPMLLTDPATGRIEHANQAASFFYEYSIAELRAMHLSDLEHDAASTHEPRIRCHRLKNGSLRHVEVHETCFSINHDKRIFLIIHDVTRKKETEKQLRSLSSELLLTEERERKQLARDLHDGIGQNLALCRIKLNLIKNAANCENHDRLINDMLALTEQMVSDTRSLMFEISPPVLYQLGLKAALEWLTEKFNEQHGICFRFKDDGRPKPLDSKTGFLLFRATRELMLNIIKHAGTRTADILLSRENDFIRITVIDQGNGFDVTKINPSDLSADFPAHPPFKGFGIFSINERIIHLGGRFTIESEPGKGSLFTMTVPVQMN